MEDITIESLIAQKSIVTTSDLTNPANDYMVVGVYQKGTNQMKGVGTSYKNYVISIAELLGGGSAYTASNGITLVGNDFQFTSQNISQFVNNSGYLTAGTIGTVAWALNGNTVGSEKFLGTIDNFALPFRVNNNEVMRITNDAAGSTRFYFNASTNLHGSNAGIQYSSDGTSPNRSQARFNIYGANTGAPGITGFKSRGVGIGTLASVLAGDNLFRLTTIGVSGNNSSINLASLIDVRVASVLPGHVATDFVVALNSIAGVMTERFYVTSEGDVGIGTSTPVAKLDVNGTGRIAGALSIVDDAGLLLNPDISVTSIYNSRLLLTNANTAVTWYLSNQVFGGGSGIDNFSIGTSSNPVSSFLNIDALGNMGVGKVGQTARLHVKGVDATSGFYGLKVDDVANVPLFYVRNDGMVNSDNGYSINNIRRFWTNLTDDIVGWNHGNASPISVGTGTRNTLFGNSDSSQPQLTTGGFNAVFGVFSGMGITSGSYNLVLGNYNVNTPTDGVKNIILGQGGMLSTSKNETLTFNGFSNNSNQVVFGSENYAKYQDWYFGRGIEANQGSVGSFEMSWYATKATPGFADRNAVVTTWKFIAGQGTGTGVGSEFLFRVAPVGVSGSTSNLLADAFKIGSEGQVSMYLLPTSPVGLVAGDLWNNLGVVNII